MTVEELEQYRGLRAEAAALQAEIWALHDTYHSPALSGIGGHGSTPSDPTSSAVMKVLDLEKKLQAKQKQIADLMESIEQWLDAVKDPEIRSIVRWHYMLGLTWKQTSAEVYGMPSYYNARAVFLRYMGRKK